MLLSFQLSRCSAITFYTESFKLCTICVGWQFIRNKQEISFINRDFSNKATCQRATQVSEQHTVSHTRGRARAQPTINVCMELIIYNA